MPKYAAGRCNTKKGSFFFRYQGIKVHFNVIVITCLRIGEYSRKCASYVFVDQNSFLLCQCPFNLRNSALPCQVTWVIWCKKNAKMLLYKNKPSFVSQNSTNQGADNACTVLLNYVTNKMLSRSWITV